MHVILFLYYIFGDNPLNMGIQLAIMDRISGLEPNISSDTG